MLIPLLAALAIGGGAGWYFKIYSPKQQRGTEPGEDYSEELDGFGDYDDGTGAFIQQKPRTRQNSHRLYPG